MTSRIRQMFGHRTPTEYSQYVRVWVAGEYVKLTPQQARRYEELARRENLDSGNPIDSEAHQMLDKLSVFAGQ